MIPAAKEHLISRFPNDDKVDHRPGRPRIDESTVPRTVKTKFSLFKPRRP